MKFGSRLFLPFAITALLFPGGLTGCGSSTDGSKGANDSAGSPGVIPADPRCVYSHCSAEPVVYATKDECDAVFNAPCLSEWQAWNSCDLQNEQCDSQGKIITSTLAPCAQKKQDLLLCGANE